MHDRNGINIGKPIEKEEKDDVRLIMYCDFCGKNVAYKVKYCRYCGRHIKDGFGDTQPLPIIDELVLQKIKRQGHKPVPWYKTILNVNKLIKQPIVWKVLHYLFALATLVIVIYIVLTFKKIDEYQILVSITGSLFAIYIWWHGY